MASVIAKVVSVVLTTGVSTEDYAKISHSGLADHHLTRDLKIRHPTMGCNKFSQDDQYTTMSMKEESFKILDDYDASSNLLKSSHSAMATNNGSGNTSLDKVSNLYDCASCADHLLGTIFTDDLTKKLTANGDGSRSKMKMHRFNS